MTKQDEQTILSDAVAIADKRIRAAAETKRLADHEASAPRRRLSAKAWRAAALKQAGHDAALIEVLRLVLTTRGAQFPAVASYVNAMAATIREREWGGIPTALTGAPATWRADREAAEREIAVIGGGLNLWSCICVSISDLTALDPSVFGDLDDVDEEQRQRAAVKDHADAALRTLAATPMEILRGVALTRGITPNPESNIAERLVAHELAGRPAPAPARPRTPEGATLLAVRA